MKVMVSLQKTLGVEVEIPDDVDPGNYAYVEEYLDWDEVEIMFDDQSADVYDVTPL